MGMKNMNYLVLMVLLFLSCKKENSKHWTEVNIKANNYLTGEPITDVACGVFYSKAGFFLNAETIALDEGFTENGQYSFGFKAKKNGFYQAEAAFDIEKYYVINFSNYLYLDYGEVNNFQFDLVPNGKLRLVFKNAPTNLDSTSNRKKITKFNFKGELEAKNKGKMKMYFIESH